MFFAVYENGAIDMKLSFEMLHKSGKILFYAQSQVVGSCKYYRLLNSKCESTPLALNGCKVHRIIQYDNHGELYVVLEVELSNGDVECVEVYRQYGFYFPPLTMVASVFRTIHRFGYDAYRGR